MAEKQYINPNNPVYISYSWANERNPDIEDDVDKLCQLMDENGILFKRDKGMGDNELIPWRGEIEESENILANGDAIIVVVSDKYLNSPHCWYELHKIMAKDGWQKRVFPIILGVNLTDDDYYNAYLEVIQNKKAYLVRKKVVEKIPLDAVESAFVSDFEKYKVDLGDFRKYLSNHKMFFEEVNYETIISHLKAHVEALTPHVSVSDAETKPSEPTIDLSSPVLNYRPDVSGLVARTKLTEELYKQLQDNQFVNMTGIGGMGKTSLSFLFVNEYADKYDKIAHILVNGDFYEEAEKEFGKLFCIKKFGKIVLSFDGNDLRNAETDNLPFLNKLISSFENISGNNLLIIDVNETANYQKVSEAIDVMRRRGMKNWNVLIIARVKIFSNVVEFTPFEIGGCDLNVAKNIFFNYLKDKSKYYQYSDDDFKDLFDTLFYSPLLIEQLAKYLLRSRRVMSKDDIFNYIKGDGESYGLQKQKLNSGTIEDQRLAKYEIINMFLSHLSDFSELDKMYKQDNQLRDIVRHMMLWKAEYYSIDTIYTFVKGLIVSKEVLREALDFLCDLRILDYSQSENGYKMHGLMAETFRKQVLEDMANDYSQYFENIIGLGYIKDTDSQIAKCVYSTWDDDDFMKKYYWSKLKSKPITEELAEKYNMVKVEGADFYICKYTVTQGDWMKIYKNNPSNFKKGNDYPVEQVNWYDAVLYIMRLNQETGLCFRLPNEAEWEFAARGGNKSKGYEYCGSNKIGEVAWYEENAQISTHIVGSKQPNELGLYDMSGNVWEWCSDWYDEYCDIRVLRGGSWNSDAYYCRVSYRPCGNSRLRDGDHGFRLALSASLENKSNVD